jgi:hypothetical protein
MWIVLQRDYRELRQTTAFKVMIIISALITIAGSIIVSLILGRQEWFRIEAAGPLLELILGITAYFLPLFILMAFIWAFASLPIVQEKVNGNLDCLLATPLGTKEIWIAKSLAVFLPAYLISAVATLIILLIVNFVTILPATGEFILPAPVLLMGFLINPLLFFGLLSFIVLFSMANNPDIAIAPSFILGFGLMIGIPLGLATGVINLASWSFTLWYLAGTLAVWIIIAYLSRLLTKENIVLSSKGE